MRALEESSELCYIYNITTLLNAGAHKGIANPNSDNRGINMNTKNQFGEVLRDLRIKAGFGLKEFAKKIGMQASNLSFIENGRVSPPRKAETLEVVAQALGLKEGSEEWALFFDGAAKPGEIPADVRKNKHISEFIPLLCRTISTSKLNKEQIQQLIKKARGFKPHHE
jgi:transcriptional regulator with XRE-family HTH domain